MIARGLVVQMNHFAGVPVGASDVQRVRGAGLIVSTTLFYSFSGYTASAVEAADLSGFGIFAYSVNADLTSVNGVARKVALSAAPPIKSTPSPGAKRTGEARVRAESTRLAPKAGTVGRGRTAVFPLPCGRVLSETAEPAGASVPPAWSPLAGPQGCIVAGPRLLDKSDGGCDPGRADELEERGDGRHSARGCPLHGVGPARRPWWATVHGPEQRRAKGQGVDLLFRSFGTRRELA